MFLRRLALLAIPAALALTGCSSLKTISVTPSSGNVNIALQASSSAAGALLMVDKVQREIRALFEPPRLQ